MINKINETAGFLQDKGIVDPEVGIVLGTGLGQLVSKIEVEQSVSYDEIPHFPISTVESHHGKLIYGTMSGKKVIAMQGRFHFYEGYNMQQITFPIRVMKRLGIKNLLLSNACGGLNPEFKKGSLMIIDDHINLLPGNPLFGRNYNELGPRFPDMSEPYSKSINRVIEEVANEKNIPIHKGVYAVVAGPNLETRAEYRFLRIIGGDVVGMSTVPEVIVSKHMELPCAAVSVITDECDPDNLQPVGLDEILEVAGKAEVKLNQIFVEVVKRL